MGSTLDCPRPATRRLPNAPHVAVPKPSRRVPNKLFRTWQEASRNLSRAKRLATLRVPSSFVRNRHRRHPRSFPPFPVTFRNAAGVRNICAMCSSVCAFFYTPRLRSRKHTCIWQADSGNRAKTNWEPVRLDGRELPPAGRLRHQPILGRGAQTAFDLCCAALCASIGLTSCERIVVSTTALRSGRCEIAPPVPREVCADL